MKNMSGAPTNKASMLRLGLFVILISLIAFALFIRTGQAIQPGAFRSFCFIAANVSRVFFYAGLAFVVAGIRQKRRLNRAH